MKKNINDLSQIAENKKLLVANNVTKIALDSIEKALRNGVVFNKPADLGMLNLGALDVKIVEELFDFGTTSTPNQPSQVRTYQFSVTPSGAAIYGSQLVVEWRDIDGMFISENYPISDDGTVLSDMDLSTIMDVITVKVKSANGEILPLRLAKNTNDTHTEHLQIKKNAFGNLELHVSLPPEKEVYYQEAVPSYQVKGKLIGDSSEKMDGYQVVIMAKTEEADEEYETVAFATTETNGYFISSFLEFSSPETISMVHEAVAMVSKDDIRQQFPIKLTHSVVNDEARSMIPRRLILVLDQDSDASSDEKCGCTGMDFHEKKVFEEYSYYTVVRTTEPSIIADVLEDEEEMDLGDLFPNVQGANGIRLPLSVLRKYNQAANKLEMISKVGSNQKRVTSTTTDTAATFARPAFDVSLLEKLKFQHKLDVVSKGKTKRQFKGRTPLSPMNQIDWDEEPTIYQAASISHGHLLQFKQEWMPDGYSMGDLLYSLPLAPGQKKQIAVLDWSRREAAARSQSMDYSEELESSLVRDRDVNEVVSSVLNENAWGKSKANTWGIGGGIGGAIMGVFTGGAYGALMGVSGGYSAGSSSASQGAHRDSAAQSAQHVSDRTQQAASFVRSQRATVVQTMTQGEAVQATTESVANYNHCHAITIQYFEVLRHFTVQTRLANVQECLFIPLQMSPFDIKKALRWRNTLQNRLLRWDLRRGFESLSRMQQEMEGPDNYYDSIGYPQKNYAEERMEQFAGELYMNFAFFNTSAVADADVIRIFSYLKIPLEQYRDKQLTSEQLSKIVGPRAIEFLVDSLEIYGVTESGAIPLKLDISMMSSFRANATMRLSVRQDANTPTNYARQDIKAIRINLVKDKFSQTDFDEVRQFGNKYMKITVQSGSLRYRSKNLSEYLFNGRLDNDLFFGDDGVYIATPLNYNELRNPRGEDIDLSNNLLQHLNENMEFYHKAIWFNMTPERRFMLLDGMVAPGKANGRSVASVVENKLIGVVGNCLVMPVAPGNQLDPTINGDFDLFSRYYNEQRDAQRISLPTKGVYAEAVMGKCNSCEEIDHSRFWKWEESPIPDSPSTPILPVNTDSRRTDPGDLNPKDFPNPVVNIQNAPSIPDPQGLSNLLALMGKSDVFRDLTGLAKNQDNARSTYDKTLDTAQSFGQEAADLAKTALTLKMIEEAHKSGLLNKEKATSAAEKTVDPKTAEEAKAKKDAETEQKNDRMNEKVDKEVAKGGLDEKQGKEIKEDGIRKTYDIPKKTAAKATGKKTYNVEVYMFDINGRPMNGQFFLTLGSLSNELIELNTEAVARFNTVMEEGKSYTLILKGNPGAPNVSYPDDPSFYYHWSTMPLVAGKEKTITVEVRQKRVPKEVEVASGISRTEIKEKAVANEVGVSGTVGAERDFLIASLEASLTVDYTHTSSETRATEDGTSSETVYKYRYYVPSPKLRMSLGYNPDANIDD